MVEFKFCVAWIEEIFLPSKEKSEMHEKYLSKY